MDASLSQYLGLSVATWSGGIGGDGGWGDSGGGGGGDIGGDQGQ